MGLVVTLPFTLTNGTTADASQVMANYHALVDGFLLAAAAGVNADITALTALSTPLPIASGGSSVYIGGTSTGSANAQVVASPTPISFSLTAGKRITFIAGFTNTGATTLNINAQGATSVFRMSPSGPQALTGGEIIAGNVVEAVYDGTQFELISVHNQFGGFGLLTTLASATTTDLGTIPSHNVSISGTTTITGFGSSASTTFPIYRITFQGALTLTYNATSLIIPGSANITTAANDTALAIYLGSGNWQVIEYVKRSGLPIVAFTNPTRQVLTSGTSATYTTPAGARQLKIREIGGGGGGGALTTNAGTDGGTTSFNSISVGGGIGALNSQASNGVGGIGGSGGSGSVSMRWNGSRGGAGGANSVTAGIALGGGSGGTSPFGGSGGGGVATDGGAAAVNSGSGGGGAGAVGGANAAGGGGSGEYAEFIINSPAASYTYTVGAGGTGGAAGVQAGGNGAAGIIIVDEFY